MPMVLAAEEIAGGRVHGDEFAVAPDASGLFVELRFTPDIVTTRGERLGRARRGKRFSTWSTSGRN